MQLSGTISVRRLVRALALALLHHLLEATLLDPDESGMVGSAQARQVKAERRCSPLECRQVTRVGRCGDHEKTPYGIVERISTTYEGAGDPRRHGDGHLDRCRGELCALCTELEQRERIACRRPVQAVCDVR